MDYFFKGLPSRPLRIMRVICGGVLFLHYLRVSPVFLEIFSTRNLGAAHPIPLPEWDAFYYALLGMILISSLLTVIGWRPRWSIGCLLLGQTLTVYLDPAAFWGWGLIIKNFLLFLWITAPYAQDEYAPAWTWRLFQIQTSLIYFISQLYRWGNKDWLSGEAVFRALSDGDVARFTSINWAPYAELLRPFSYGTIVLEWLGAFLVFLGPLQPLIAVALIAMHAVLQVAAKIQGWQPLMIGALLFYLPAKIYRAKGEAPAFKPNPILGPTILVCFIFVVIHAIPKNLLSERLQRAQEWIGYPVRLSTFTGTSNMDMFSTLGAPGRKCGFAVAFKGAGEFATLVQGEIRENEVMATILRSQRYSNPLRNLKIGRYLCRHSPERVPAVFVGRWIEPDFVEPVFGFRCGLNELADRVPPALTEYVRQHNCFTN